MPKVAADDVIHAAFTDHKIRIVREGESQPTTTDEQADLLPYFEEDARDDVLQGMAYIVFASQQGPVGSAQKRRGITILEQALAKRPGIGEAQFLLGIALYQNGKVREAIAPLEAAVEIEAVPERLNALAQAYEAAGRSPAESEGLYRRALEIQPAAANIRVNLARLLEAQQNLAASITEYRVALREDPWLVQGHTLLGGALAKSGMVPDAITALREAVTLDPTQADALTNLGVLIAQAGSPSEGGALFRRAVQADPTNANALANLALFFANEGRPNEALRYAEEAIRRNPQQGTALQVLEVLRQSTR